MRYAARDTQFLRWRDLNIKTSNSKTREFLNYTPLLARLNRRGADLYAYQHLA
jgi:hypothetical protein